ncbi:uncharacterized protein BX664DRAFT_340077 [Halteromyces radiatus]|uniref:uncharacterized protein n=1 Tax=Halteromyces radiatus TaxID=101107 RepID=UPI002220C436|nr:uncharacterized protein BX664DRAFT_340077 [Halteromyces radiatus]KAI8081299.1 hypothetical protein BX664DRAFT_340077 [Halteromyces radiatus]
MNENTSPVSTPSSGKLSLPLLKSKTNLSRSDATSDGKLDDNKKSSLTASPVRSPLRDKNSSVITLPIRQSPSSKEIQYHTSPATIHQQHHRHTSPSKQQQVKVQDLEGIQHRRRRNLYDTQQRSPSNKPSPTEVIFTPKPLSPTKSWNLTERILAKEEKSLEARVQHQQKELDTLNTTLNAERQKTADVRKWMMDMVQLVQKFKEIQCDMDESVDMLVEFDNTMDELIKEQQQDMARQLEIDRLMNLIPEKLVEIEELKTHMKK